MTDRFKVVSLEEAAKYDEELRWQLGENNPWFDEFADHLLDTKTGQIVYSDGGEPEDMTLGRNLRDFVDLLNRVARGE